MGQPNPPQGLIVDLLTPVKRTGEINGRCLGRYLDHLIPYARGFFLGGPYLGDGSNLTREQQEDLLEKTLVLVKGKVPLFIWFSRKTEDESRESLIGLNKLLLKKGYEGPVYWVDTPLLYHSNRGLPSLYQNYASLVKDDFILHNDSALVKAIARPLKRTNIRTSVLKEIGQNDRIRGLIFSGTLDRNHNYQRAVRSRTDFNIYDGDESRFLSFPSLSGVISRGANLTPKAWARITRASLHLTDEGEDYPDSRSQIWEIGGYLKDLMSIYDLHGPDVIKRGLVEMGLCEELREDIGEIKPEVAIKNLMEIIKRINA